MKTTDTLTRAPRELTDVLQEQNGRLKTALSMLAAMHRANEPDVLLRMGRLLKQEGYL